MQSSSSVLFLQGVASPFFSALANRLADEGSQIYRVNFCGGDRFFDSPNPKQAESSGTSWDFQQPIDQFPAWFDDKLTQHTITDIVLFGDSRPVHKDAIKLARSRHINIHVYEEGYIRPNRITLEQEGVNANSMLSRDPDWYLEHGGTFPSYPSDDTGSSLRVRAWHDVRYHIASFTMRRHFSHYSTHRPDGPLREYLGWMWRFPTLLFHDRNGNRKIKDIIKEQKHVIKSESNAKNNANNGYYFLPLQLNADTQIRAHSDFQNVSEVIEHTIHSFASHAPKQTRLVIKNHPLDTGFVNYRKLIKDLVKHHKLDERVVYLEDGYLPTMVRHAKGVVLVNSTVGTSALYHRRPTCVLGKAIYDMQGLTYQGGLDTFWTEGKPPEKALFQKFCNAIIHLTQINGDFYSKKGIHMAVEGSLRFFDLSSTKKKVMLDVMLDKVEQQEDLSQVHHAVQVTGESLQVAIKS